MRLPLPVRRLICALSRHLWVEWPLYKTRGSPEEGYFTYLIGYKFRCRRCWQKRRQSFEHIWNRPVPKELLDKLGLTPKMVSGGKT